MKSRLAALLDRTARVGLDRLERVTERRWSAAPLCAAPLATDEEYLRRWEQVRSERFASIDAFERTCGAAVDPEWFHRLGLATQVTIKQSALCYQHGRVLYAVLRRYLRDQQADDVTIVETGTARGFSAVCLARALADHGAHGRISTFDVLPHERPIYWNCIGDGAGPRTRAQLLAPYADLLERSIVFHQGDSRVAIRRVVFPRVHVAFFDSVHTYEHLHAEYAAVRSRQHPGDMVVFDDYLGYAGVRRAADEICAADRYAGELVAATPERGYLVARKQ